MTVTRRTVTRRRWWWSLRHNGRSEGGGKLATNTVEDIVYIHATARAA
jgi:hypothetical protein